MAIKHFRNFSQATGGNVAVITAFAIIPILILVGSVIDYSRGLRVKTVLQAAVDAAALNTARQSPGLTTAQMLVIAQNSVAGAFNVGGLGEPVTTLTYTAAGTENARIKVSASVAVPNSFMSLFGFASNAVAATSTSTWGNTKLRVALALDNTGSMKGDKILALRTATTNLLTSLQNAAVKDGDVYVSIIPFSTAVKVDTSNVSASWIRWTEWEADAGNQTCTGKGNSKVCKPNSRSTWDGSIMDRDQNYDLSNATPTSNSTFFPAAPAGTGTASLMGLTYNWAALRAKVPDMVPAGNTNQPIGLAWAWQSLTMSAPLNAPAKDPKFNYADVIILLTDGDNTQNRTSSNKATIDGRQKKLCDAIKATGVTIYAVQVNTDKEALQTALQYCASDPSKFVMLTTADQIITTFASIGASLSQLHLSR
ncbi:MULTISPECIES: pilus assembly protein [unclassified Beijerinckia]|uniref:pilus assembly protein n=1 Tax=unclassified Beijerinckia TaxID=2638183 RepID=UPI000898FFB0|nr:MULTISPECIES: pilus assembly protein [unclassified Beijerinckia]MDH7796190.1 uncharacterized protein YegL [Beijerinckia sp. GAS462]SEC34245.1 Putative Flp pilus-assembly TadE/G-like [Beijerinckia sp. 28-YEA-48]